MSISTRKPAFFATLDHLSSIVPAHLAQLLSKAAQCAPVIPLALLASRDTTSSQVIILVQLAVVL
jgi:hypothetical protein